MKESSCAACICSSCSRRSSLQCKSCPYCGGCEAAWCGNTAEPGHDVKKSVWRKWLERWTS